MIIADRAKKGSRTSSDAFLAKGSSSRHQDAAGGEDLPVIAWDKLLDDLRRSGLVDEERLSRFLGDQEAEAGGESLLRKLVDAGLLTPWQSEGLSAGKWRGFFLGNYKLLQPLG